MDETSHLWGSFLGASNSLEVLAEKAEVLSRFALGGMDSSSTLANSLTESEISKEAAEHSRGEMLAFRLRIVASQASKCLTRPQIDQLMTVLIELSIRGALQKSEFSALDARAWSVQVLQRYNDLADFQKWLRDDGWAATGTLFGESFGRQCDLLLGHRSAALIVHLTLIELRHVERWRILILLSGVESN